MLGKQKLLGSGCEAKIRSVVINRVVVVVELNCAYDMVLHFH